MSQRKALSTLAVPADPGQIADRLNRELIPKLRQVTPGTAVTGARTIAGLANPAVVAQILTILANAGIITDSTTP